MARDKRNFELILSAKNNTTKAFRQIEKGFNVLKKSVFSVQAAIAGLAGAAGFGALVASSLKAGDSLAKTADKLGVTTEGLAGLRHAAKLTGVEASKLDTALQRMTRRIAEAAQGSGEAQGALSELGLDAQRLAAMRPDQAFAEIAEAMQNVENQSDRVRLAFKLFDSGGVDLVNTLKLGKEGLAGMASEAETLGLAISRVDAAKIEQANDAIERASGAVKGVGMAITVELAPYLEELAGVLAETARESGGFRKEISSAMALGTEGVSGLIRAFTGLRVVWEAMRYDFLAFQESLWEALVALREYNVAVRERMSAAGFASDESEGLAEARRILEEQRIILEAVRINKEDALQSGANALALHEQINQKLAEYRQRIIEASEAAAGTTAASSSGLRASRPVIGTGSGGSTSSGAVVGGNEKAASGFDYPLGAAMGIGTKDAVDPGNFSLLGDAVKDVTTDMGVLEERTVQVGATMDQFAVQAARNIQSSFADFLFNPFEDGLDGMLKSFLKTIQRMAAELAAKQILSGIFSGMGSAGGAFGAIGTALAGSLYHDGGLVKGQAQPKAIRLHGGGLLSDEVPAVLQRGERVLSREQNQLFEKFSNRSESGGVTINITEESGTKAEVTNQRRGPDGQTMIDIMVKSSIDRLAGTGQLDRTMKANYGVRRPGRS